MSDETPSPAPRSPASPSPAQRAAEEMTGAGALPGDSDGPIFEEPWQGRAVAIAVETVDHLGLEWDAFRSRLMASIESAPNRPYYASWLEALEALVVDHGVAADDTLLDNRMVAAAYRTTDVVADDLEVFPFELDRERAADLLSFLGRDWGEAIDLVDGLEDLAFGCRHAELQRRWVDGGPRHWALVLFQDGGEAAITIPLPSPHDARPDPDWARLACWNALRFRYLSLPPDPRDRSG